MTIELALFLMVMLNLAALCFAIKTLIILKVQKKQLESIFEKKRGKGRRDKNIQTKQSKV